MDLGYALSKHDNGLAGPKPNWENTAACMQWRFLGSSVGISKDVTGATFRKLSIALGVSADWLLELVDDDTDEEAA